MAVQMGILPLAGSIGNISFYKYGDKWVARTKGGASAEKVATDPNMQRTRENASEFGTAARAGKLLRTALQPLAYPLADNRMVRRLTSKMLLALQADAIGYKGLRKVIDGNLDVLKGFEFNERGKLSVNFYAPYNSDINRETGEFNISIPPFIPTSHVTSPVSATHFKLYAGGAALDFENGAFSAEFDSSPEIALNGLATEEIILNNQLPANSTHPMFLVLGIEFLQEVNGGTYSLKDSAYNGLVMVKVSAG